MKIGAIKDIGRRIEQGGWVTKIAGMGDLQLKVRARFNTDYVRRQKELWDQAPESDKRRDPETEQPVLTDEAQRRHDAILLRDTVLVDWRNLEDEDGRQVPFSAEVASELLLDPEQPAFRNAVSFAAMKVAIDGKNDVEADKGN